MGRYVKRKYNASAQTQTTVQVLLDQTIGVAIFFPLYFFVFEIVSSIAALRVPDLSLARHTCATQLRSVIVTQYSLWPAANWCIFRYVPEPLRVLATSVVNVFWNAYLCTRVATNV